MSDVSKISSSNIVKIGSILNIQIYTAKCRFLTTKKGASNYLKLKIVSCAEVIFLQLKLPTFLKYPVA